MTPTVVVPRVLDVGVSLGAPGVCLVWSPPVPVRALSSAVLGGGLVDASWVLNTTVDDSYARMDPEAHLAEIAGRAELVGVGVGLMTAVDVASFTTCVVDGVRVDVTVGVRRPVYAAVPLDRDDDGETDDGETDVGQRGGVAARRPGTINVVAQVPARLTDAALVNVIATVAEAKVQAMYDTGVPGTGTASDAVCVLCARNGTSDPFGGPRSSWGRRLALATYDAVVAGVVRQRSS